MTSTASACSLLLLTMAALSSGRNATQYIPQAQFQYSPSRPDDAIVFSVGPGPPFICEPDGGDGQTVVRRMEPDFHLHLPLGYTLYRCYFAGNTPKAANFLVMQHGAPNLFRFIEGQGVKFAAKMHCSSDSPLPDEYFHLKIQRPRDDRPVRCRVRTGSGALYVRFPGYPTIFCHLADEEGRFIFKLPVLDDEFNCAFRVYSELPLGDTQTEKRLYQSLVNGLPSRVDGVACSRSAASNATAHFQLQLADGATYDCSFPDAATRNLPET